VLTLKPSIQNKVRYGYYICIALIIISAVLNYFNLRTIDKKITFSFIISDFFDSTLEMRRYEKNYFLYKEQREYRENLYFTEKAEHLINKNREAIRLLSPAADVAAIENEIHQYKALMLRYQGSHGKLDFPALNALESKIRETGKKIVEATERISIAERSYLQSIIAFSKKILLITVVLVIVIGVLIGQFFAKMVVQPLKQLEESMQRIADGEFDKIYIQSPDAEIVSLSNACSRMIKEIELRQKRFMMQSEKLITLGTMVSGVAHELNNPLSNIYSSCQILHEEIDHAELEHKKQMLGQIESEVERAKIMIQSLLEFSRKTEFKRKPYSLKYLFDETIRLIQGDIPTKVEITSSLPEDAWVFVDKQKMQQAFLNIIKNAVDAIPGEGRVSIYTEKSSDGRTMHVKIRDNGIGIEPQRLEKIFDPFFTTKEEGKGSGLGLFITREIIEEHQGAIAVESSPGEGTVFTVTLPVKEA
jgi:signal transduction histidine kinase